MKEAPGLVHLRADRHSRHYALLRCLDNLDAKVNAFQQLMREDPNVDSPWTNFHPNLNRKLFKGKQKREG
jgi:hypothetical protein